MPRLAKLALGVLALGLLCSTVRAETVRKIVVFNESTAPSQRVAIAVNAGGKLVRTLELINAVVIEVPKEKVAAAQAELGRRMEVLRVDEDPFINWLQAGAPAGYAQTPLPDIGSMIRPFKRSEQAPLRATAGEQQLPWGIKRVNAPAAWAATRGKGAKVVVIDTGIDSTHPDLKGNVVGGWNAITKGDDYMDDHGHGTHVAGTIGALDNDEGVVGVAPQVSIYGVKVLNANGGGTFDDVIAGMEWAVKNKMDIASMSLGASSGNESLKAIVEVMVKEGVTLIAAAGNSYCYGENSTVVYPAAYPGAIAIAASNSADGVAEFSSCGPEVAFITPGADVLSTVPGGKYQTMSGTSMATPHASGLAALLVSSKGVHGSENIRAAFKNAAVPFADVPANKQGAGLIDAVKLVQ